MGGLESPDASMQDRISNRALHYFPNEDANRPVLHEFDDKVEELLGFYTPSVARNRSHALFFHQLYKAALDPEPDDVPGPVPSAVIAAFLAAELEFRSPLRLSGRQSIQLAEEFEAVAGVFSAARLHHHAIRAYQRAKALHRMTEDTEGEDRCGLLLARARTAAQPDAWRRGLGRLADILCGYGYRPSWLLGWVVVQLAFFTALVLAIGGGESNWNLTYMALTTFLGPLGPGNLGQVDGAAHVVFGVESWAGALTMAVYFALLVRRWFRM